MYGVTNLIDTEALELVARAAMWRPSSPYLRGRSCVPDVQPLYPPCFAALGAMNSEMKSGKWLLGGICLQLATGYTVAFLVYQIGTLITTGALGTGFVPGLIAVLVFAAVIVWRIRVSDKEFAAEYKLGAQA